MKSKFENISYNKKSLVEDESKDKAENEIEGETKGKAEDGLEALSQEKIDTDPLSKYPEYIRQHYLDLQEFIISNSHYFDAVGGTAESPNYVIDDDLKSMNFWYSHENNEIGISLKSYIDMKEGNLDPSQILFVIGHELAHFNDMRDDPTGYIENFDNNFKKALKMAPKIIEIWRERGADIPDWLTPEIVVKQYLGRKYHNLYNAIDDIYVNRYNLRAMPRFKGNYNGFNDEVRDLYADYAFPNPGKSEVADYTNMPLHMQLENYLLRKYMVPDQEILVDPVVLEAINKAPTKIDQKLGNTLIKIVSDFTRPTSKYEDVQHIASYRYALIEQLIDPVFEKFLLKDAEIMNIPKFSDKEQKQSSNNQEQQEGEPQEGEPGDQEQQGSESQEGEPGDQEQQEGESKSRKGDPNWNWDKDDTSHSISKEDVEKYLDDLKNQKRKDRKKEKEQKAKAKKAQISVEELMEINKRKHDYKVAEQNNIPRQVIDTYEELAQDVEQYKNNLTDVFSQIMENIENRIALIWEGGWSKGRLNVDRFIDKYGEMMASGRYEYIPWQKLDVYDQQEFIEKLTIFPNKIRLRLSIDTSSSMNRSVGTTKRNRAMEAARIAVLMMESLKLFESRINQRFRLKDKFYVDTEITTFNNDATVVKPFDSLNPNIDKQIERWRALQYILSPRGSTDNSGVWGRINQEVDSSYASDLLNDRAMELCFEITDGGVKNTSIANASREYIDNLEKKGVHLTGFLIGDRNDSGEVVVDGSDRALFNMIWNDGVSEPRGFLVTTEDLAEIIANKFSKIIKEKEVKISSETEEGL